MSYFSSNSNSQDAFDNSNSDKGFQQTPSSKYDNLNASSYMPKQNRLVAVVFIFLAVVFIIILRLFALQIVDAEANSKAAVESRTVSYTTSPKRGTIYDRNGNVLAYSKEATTIYANPSEIENVDKTAVSLSSVLGKDKSKYEDLINDNSKKFAYIERHIENEEANRVKDLQLKGIYFVEDNKRVYPYGKIAGQIVGTVNIDGDGLCGLELYYDDILRGSSGLTVEQQGQAGMPIPGGSYQKTDVIDGQDLMISIDIELQQKVEEYLTAYNQKLGGSSMHSVVEDPLTGEVYAAASLPLLDPTDLSSIEDGATELRCVSSTFEPGSTFKTASATAVLEADVVKPNEQIYCPSHLQADEYYVSDAHDRPDTVYTFKEIIAKSSNVGISLCTERLGFDKLYQKILKYNLNSDTGIDFPGDTTGYLADQKEWSKIQSYNVSFGQGVTVTPLQTTKFYSALANNGIEINPHFLMRYLQKNEDVEYPSTNAIENKAAIPQMIDMLREVVTNGTGTPCAKLEPYGSCGKTGTGEIADSNGKYLSGIYYCSFVGFLSNANLPLVCFVGSENTPSQASVCPVYNDIMSFAVERFKIVPEK